jgi:uncharacterized metal-binding protein
LSIEHTAHIQCRSSNDSIALDVAAATEGSRRCAVVADNDEPPNGAPHISHLVARAAFCAYVHRSHVHVGPALVAVVAVACVDVVVVINIVLIVVVVLELAFASLDGARRVVPHTAQTSVNSSFLSVHSEQSQCRSSSLAAFCEFTSTKSYSDASQFTQRIRPTSSLMNLHRGHTSTFVSFTAVFRERFVFVVVVVVIGAVVVVVAVTVVDVVSISSSS